jgi:AMP nucleosidase
MRTVSDEIYDNEEGELCLGATALGTGEKMTANQNNRAAAKIARESLERYTGSKVEDFGSYLILTNFPRYVEYFAESRNVKSVRGSNFHVAHGVDEDVSVLNFRMGSPMASLVVDLCSHLPFKACLLLGMCGGLRRHYKIGDYFVPVASIRGEGTSDFYFPPEVPALSNFLIQRAVSEVLQERKVPYHIGITHTTNIRFWEFNEPFKEMLKKTRAQGIEMECATLFAASYHAKMPLGALLIISDLPLEERGVKTKASSEEVFQRYTAGHVEKGIAIMQRVKELQDQGVKGAFRGQVASS